MVFLVAWIQTFQFTQLIRNDFLRFFRQFTLFQFFRKFTNLIHRFLLIRPLTPCPRLLLFNLGFRLQHLNNPPEPILLLILALTLTENLRLPHEPFNPLKLSLQNLHQMIQPIVKAINLQHKLPLIPCLVPYRKRN